MGFFFGLTLFLGVYWFFRSPLPAALADSMRRNAGVAADAALGDAVAMLRDDVHGLREDLNELAERLDVSERVLADLRQRIALPDSSARERSS